MGSRSLLISDLDGTLLGDEEALDRFAHWHQANRRHLSLVYASGRFFDSVVGLIGSTSLPEPDAVIGGVGTEIHRYADRRRVSGWPRCLDRWDPQGIQTVLAEFRKLEPQPTEFQRKFKLSYYAHELDTAFLVELRRRLVMSGHGVEIIYSSSRDLDVLPAGISKGSAAAFLASQWHLGPWQVIVSGDTGNDASMFMHGFRGIVVGNAQPELKAIRSPDIYHSKQAYAAGVLDGMEYWLKRQPAPALES